jgi:hypothetical protein
LRHRLCDRPVPAANQPDPRWLISDLVTLGSPLTHAEFLIAADRADLERRMAARELPKSPPYRERLDPNVLHHAQATHAMPIANPPDQTRLMSYPVVNTNDIWMLHHAAPFAPCDGLTSTIQRCWCSSATSSAARFAAFLARPSLTSISRSDVAIASL